MNGWIRFRPWESVNGPQVEIRDISSNRSFAADALGLARCVADGSDLPIPGHDQSAVNEQYRTWYDHGWGDAVPFYLATLDGDFVDCGSNYRDLHEKVLALYAQEETAPKETYPSTGITPLPYATQPRPRRLGGLLRSRRSTLVPKRAPLDRDQFAGIMAQATEVLAAFRAPEIASDPQNALVNFGPSLDIYVVIYDINGIAPGVYRYDVRQRFLYLLNSGDMRDEMRAALVGQPAPLTAAVSVVYVSDVKRHQWRYRHARALRGLWIDSAKVVNHLLWSLASLGIAPHMTPAVADSTICRILGLEPNLDSEVMYVVSFGGAPGEVRSL